MVKRKLWLLAILSLIVIVAVFMLPPISQDLAFHNFADDRAFFGIVNFWNVFSNLPFLIVGITGLLSLKKAHPAKGIAVIYGVLFTAILLTGLGSAYYHYSPGNNSLVYDRMPMTIVFMSLLSATVTELIDVKAGCQAVAAAGADRCDQCVMVALWRVAWQGGSPVIFSRSVLSDGVHSADTFPFSFARE